jgi:sulfide:quinone oxidoreductase
MLDDVVSGLSGCATSPARVVIAGGGFAALEAALALRALAKRRVDLTLVSPQAAFVYRPAATIDAFDEARSRHHDLGEIAADLGAHRHRDRLEAVAPRPRFVRLASGRTLEYDFLVLAVGARPRAAVPGALTFRDQRDVPQFKALLDQLTAGEIRRLVFAVPSLESWSLPVYELALLAAKQVALHGVDAETSVVTPEPAPLAVFGASASRAVAELLDERGITFIGSSIPHSVRKGSLALQFDAPIDADRVVAVPELLGPRISGVPGTWSGFVPTDASGRVEGLERVYAAGDLTTYPVKQGGIAAQQADHIAYAIAADLGVAVKQLRQTRILRARLLDGDGALVLRTELDSFGHPTRATIEHRESRHAPDLKVFGLYLTPYLSIHRSRREAVA